MRLEKRERFYYINSTRINRKALEEIVEEIFHSDAWQRIFEKLVGGESVTIEFGKQYLIPNILAELEQVKKQNRLLESKLAAVEKMYCEMRTA